MPGTNSWQLRDGEQVISCNTSLLGHRHFLIGITRVRNEALVLRDTLDYVGKHVDAIVAYDDAIRTARWTFFANTRNRAIVANQSWEADIAARRIAEGRHRGLLLQTAREHLQFDWMFCFDADERVTGDLRSSWKQRIPAIATACGFSCSTPMSPPAIRRPIKPVANCWAFAASSAGTAGHSDVVAKPAGGRLRGAPWAGAGRRRTRGDRPLLPTLWQGAVGRTLGRDCEYYMRHFPFDTYGRKWRDRKGGQSTPNRTSCGPCTNGRHALRQCGEDLTFVRQRAGDDPRTSLCGPPDESRVPNACMARGFDVSCRLGHAILLWQ